MICVIDDICKWSRLIYIKEGGYWCGVMFCIENWDKGNGEYYNVLNIVRLNKIIYLVMK